MSIKDDIIKLINAVYRVDEFITSYTEAVAKVFNQINLWLDSVKNNMFFDSLDEDGAKWWEAYLKIVPKPTQSLSDRQAQIQAKYLSNNHNEIKLIQRVCDAWQNGEIEADFVEGKIQLKYIGENELNNFQSIIFAVNETKPAHIPIYFMYEMSTQIKADVRVGLVDTSYSVFDCRN